MDKKNVIVIGATGLVGSLVVKNLVSDRHVNSIVCFVRKAQTSSEKKLVYIESDLLNFYDYNLVFSEATDVICCIGTTMKKAKSKKQFLHVDFDIPVLLATVAKKYNVNSFSLVSSLGANKNSCLFYLKVKGKLEEKIKSINFPATLIYRPSLLVGKRYEIRMFEKTFLKVFRWINLVIPTLIKPTNSFKLAKFMQKQLHANNKGVNIFNNNFT